MNRTRPPFSDFIMGNARLRTTARLSLSQLRNLSKIRKCLTQESSEIIIAVHFLLHLKWSRLLIPIHCPQDRSLLGRVNFVNTNSFDLQRLPVSYHVLFKLLLSVFKSLNNLPPSYLADRLSYQRRSRNLWSASQQLLEQPRKLTGTRLFRSAPLNCGTHYHKLDLRKLPSLASLKK